MASAPAENIPQLSQIDIFLKKNIFHLFVVGFLGSTEEGQPGGPRGQVLEFPEPWLSLNQTPLLQLEIHCFFTLNRKPNSRIVDFRYSPSFRPVDTKRKVEDSEKVRKRADWVDRWAEFLGKGHCCCAVEAAQVHEAGRPCGPCSVGACEAVNQHASPRTEFSIHKVKQDLCRWWQGRGVSELVAPHKTHLRPLIG